MTPNTVEDCASCFVNHGTVDLRDVFNCNLQHSRRICETCTQRFRTTWQTREIRGRDFPAHLWTCPLCRATLREDDAEYSIARARFLGTSLQSFIAPARPAAQTPTQAHTAPPSQNIQNNNNGGGGKNGAKAILLMATIGTLYFTTKYIYNRFQPQEKPVSTADDSSDFGFDNTCPNVISDSDIDTFESSNNQSEVLIDEDWFD